MRAPRPLQFALVAGALALLAPRPARAHSNGIDTSDCTGCHSGGRVPAIDLTITPPVPAPGSVAQLRITVQAINGPIAGFALHSNGPGAFQLVAGQPTRLVGEDGVVHSTPGVASGGSVTFDLRWQAPATPGGVDFDLAALSANRNGSTSGDGGGFIRVSTTYGCTGVTYYRDLDGDGYGSMGSGTTRACMLPMGYSATNDDCNDSDERVHPGAAERCNMRDDNCNGMADEGLATMTFYPDMDGDGYGGRGGTGVMGCGMTGYGVGNNDCDDHDPTVNPGAAEVCDGRDNNCNGQIDERVRPVCGTGWCARAAYTCDVRDCTPGPPMAETCNAFDDDCNGAIDDGPGLCPPGQVCNAGSCVPAGSVPPDGGTGPSSGDGGRPLGSDSGTDPMSTPGVGCGAAPGRPSGTRLGLVLFAFVCALAGARLRILRDT